MATKLSADKLAGRYGKITDALGKIDARKAKAERTLNSIEGEREELSLKRDLIEVQFRAAGGDPADLPTEPSGDAVTVETVEASEFDEDFEDEDDETDAA